MSQINDFLDAPGAPSDIDSFLGAEPAKEPGMLLRFGRGLSNTANAARIAATDDAGGIAGIIAESQRKALPASPIQQQMASEIAPYVEKARNAKGVVDNVLEYGSLAGKRISQFASNPGEFAGMVAENLPNSAPGLAGGLAGAAAGSALAGPIGAAVGGVTGGTLGGYAVEQGSAMQDQILKEAAARGVNPTDQAAMASLIKEKYPEFLSASRLKGVGTAGTDAVLNVATLGLAGMGERTLVKEAQALTSMVSAGKITAEQGAKGLAEIEAKNAARNTLGAKSLRGASIAGSEMVGEGVSEGVGQQLAYGELDPGDVVDEALLGLGTGVGMAAGHKAASSITGVTEKDAIESSIQGAKAALAATNPETLTADSNQANNELGAIGDQYADLSTQEQIGFDPSVRNVITPENVSGRPLPRNIVEVERQDGQGTTRIDRSTGPLSAAAADAVEGGLTASMAAQVGPLIKSYANQQEAQAALEQRPDAERMQIGRHPRATDRFAVLPKTADALNSMDAKAAAKASNETRTQQVEQEDGNAQAPVDPTSLTVESAIATVDDAAHMAATSPTNARPEPTEKQKAAGNYPKGHLTLNGMRVAVENPVGSTRSGVDEKGKPWQTQMQHHYGYVKGSTGNDGDKVDLFIKPQTPLNYSGSVFVIDQINPRTGAFDEHKAIVGAASAEEAKAIYRSNYAKGWKGMGPVTEMPFTAFKTWVRDGEKTAPVSQDAKALQAAQAAQDELQAPVAQPVGTMPGAQKMGARMAEAARVANQTRAAALAQEEAPAPAPVVTPKPAAKVTPTAEQTAQASRAVAQEAEDAEVRQSTGKESKVRSPRLPGESDAAYQARRAAEVNKQKPQAAKELPTKGSDTEALRQALGEKSNGTEEAVPVADLPDATRAGPQEVSKQAAAFIGHVAKLFGKRAVFVKGMSADGMRNAGNAIYLSTQSSVAHLRVLGHEMLHALKAQNPEAYRNMLSAVSHLLTDKEFAEQHKDYFGTEMLEGYLTKETREMLAEEWMADLSGNRFAEEGFWKDVFTQVEATHGTVAAKGIIARLRMAIANALNKLLKLVNGNRFAVDARMGEHLAGIRKAVADGFAQYAVDVKAGRVADEGTEGAKFSRKSTKDLGATRDEENQVSVIVGGKPGEFKWNFHGDEKAPPFGSPTQGIVPRLSKIGPAVHKMLQSKGVRDIAESLGITNLRVTATWGSWKGQEEPSFVIDGDGMTFENANELSKVLGFGMAQDATIVTQPVYAGDKDTWPALYLGNGKKLTDSEISATISAAKKEGLDYTSSTDGRAFKFFFDGSELTSFREKVEAVAKSAGFSQIGVFDTRSTFNDSKDYQQGGDRQSLRGDSQTSGGPSGLFRRTVDHVLIPYAKAVGAEGYRFSVDRFADRFGLSGSDRELITDALRPRNGRKRSTVDILTGEEPLPIAGTGRNGKVNNVDVMTALQNRAAEDGLISPADRSDAAKKVMSESIADEIIHHISRPEGKSAIGWYDAALKKAKVVYQRLFPDIAIDRDKEMLFDAVLGIASQGNDVHANSLYASRMKELTQQGKTLPEAAAILKGTFGEQTRAIEGNYLKLHALLEQNGFDTLRAAMNKRQTLGAWNAELRANEKLWVDGKPLQITGAAEQEVTGWFVFGPKIGSFINNLHGDYSTLTADLWFTRSWNRLLGHMFNHVPEGEGPQYQSFKKALIAENEGATGPRDVKGNGTVVHWKHGKDAVGFSKEKMDALVTDPDAMLAYAEELEAKFRKGGYKNGSDLQRAAKRWVEFRNDAVAAPRSDTERLFQQQTMEAAQKIIKRKTGTAINIADMQAALWYHEKELYAKLGAAGVKRAPADYADAAANLEKTYADGNLFKQQGDGTYITGEKGDYLPGGPAFSLARYGRPDERSGRGSDSSPDGTPPRYGKPVAGASSAVGYHFSKQPRTALNSNLYGHGLKGLESVRLEGADNSDIRPRTFFYLDAGNGVRPEDGVGGYGHRVQLDNLYNASEDRLDIIKGVRGMPGDKANNWERAVLNAGFDGYIVAEPKANQHFAVLLGAKHNAVPVESYNPPGYSAPKAPAAPYKRGLMSAELRKIDMPAVQAVAPSAQLRTGNFTVDQAELKAARIEMAKQGIELPEAKFSEKRQPFYSALAKEIGAMKMQVAPAFGWRDAIKGLVNKGLVKQDEIEWSGLNDWLELQTGKVTRDQVVQYLDANGVQVNETVLGDQPDVMEYIVYGRGGNFGSSREQILGTFDSDEEANDFIDNNVDNYFSMRVVDSANPEKDDNPSATKYEQYVLQGGENYREVLLTLPTKKEQWVMRQVPSGKWEILLNDGSRSLGLFKTEGDAGSELDYVNRTAGESQKGVFKSAHWDQKNVLAHLRVDDRTDDTGARVLMVQELQSDWGQDGKKKGFAGDSAKRAAIIENKIRDGSATRQEFNELLTLQKSGKDVGVPTAPFVTSTPGWLNLALKRVITMAVQGGYDKVAFVNGEQSAERYSLGGQIDTLLFDPSDGNVIGRKGGANVVTKSVDNSGEIEGLVGKEISERLLKSPKNGYGMHEISGVDLKLGGEGMKAFYDKIVPNAASALLKKLGGGKMETVDLPQGTQSAMTGEWSDGVLNQPGFTITQAMQEKAAEGLPMFSKKRIVGDQGRVYTAAQLAAFDRTGARVVEPTLKERAQALWKDAGKKMAQGIADQFAPVKDLDGKAYGLLRLAKGASGSFEALLQGGKLKLTDNVYDIDTAQRGGVVDKLLKPLQGEHHDFMRWVAAHRAEGLMSQGKENLFTPEDIKAYKTLADGTTKFDYTIQNGIRRGQVTRNRLDIYRDSQETFKAFNKNVLDMAEQSGLIDGSTRHLWESEFYVPFYRVADEADGGVRGMNIKGAAVRQQAFKKLKGGKDALNADLLDNTLMNWAHLLDAAAKNRAAKATIEAAEALGIAMGGNQTSLAQMGASIHNKNGVVWFMDGGVKRYSLIDNQGEGPYIMTALTSLEYAGMRNPVMNAMSTMKSALTIGVTASPFFKVRNLIRDSVQVIGTGQISYNPGKNLKDGWKLTDPKSDAYFRLLAGGGTIHFATMLEGNEAKRVQAMVESGIDEATLLTDPAKVKAFYRKYLEPALTAYNELGNRGEAVNRASLYDQLRKQGVSHADASLQARDLMDFSMQGSWTWVRFLTQVVPFMNARIQGLYKLGRATKEDPARIATVLGATALLSLSLLAAYHDDDDWRKRTDADRNNWWWFKFGGQAFRIPKPFEVGAIGTLAERGFELAFDKEMTDKRFMAQVLTLLGDNLSMNPVPQLVKPVLDVYANLNSFSGNPIENMAQQKLKSEYRFNDRTSMFARGASTALNDVTGVFGKEALSPVQIDHMLQGYFGWLGTFVVSSADVLARPATGQPEQATPDYLKVITGNMISDMRDAPSRYVGQMYAQAQEIEKAQGTWRALLKEGKEEEAKTFMEGNRESITKYQQIERAKKSETLFNNMLRMVERNTTMSADDKRERIRAIQAQKDKVARTVS